MCSSGARVLSAVRGASNTFKVLKTAADRGFQSRETVMTASEHWDEAVMEAFYMERPRAQLRVRDVNQMSGRMSGNPTPWVRLCGVGSVLGLSDKAVREQSIIVHDKRTDS